MKVLNKEKFVAKVIENAKKYGNDEGQIYTMRKVAENTKEARLEGEKALVLLGMNVYTLTYPAFTDAVKSEMYEIEDSEYDAVCMAKELDEKDPKIFKK